MASLDTLPQCVKACWELLHSEAFFLLLSNFTGLRLHFLCPADDDDEEKEKEVKKEEKTEEEAATGGETTASLDRSPPANTNSGKGVCHYSRVCACACVRTCIFTFMCTLELSTPVCCGELRRWSHGGYTLLHDGEAAQAEYALDLVLPFGCAGELPTTLSLSHTHTQRVFSQIGDCYNS